jgi:RNA polymerase sigma factor (sigma-70 family)
MEGLARNFPAASLFLTTKDASLPLEATALQHAGRMQALGGRSPLLRLQSDERLVALIRRGQHGAFEALVHRYQPRLLAFCRHMLGSTEDAEDVLQEVFAAAFNAMLADERPINARPWLYRIARNRCLNHLRRPAPTGQDSMDIFERDGGATTADTVHKREEFRQIVADVQDLPETQRTALLLREIDALSYEQIAEAMETTIPSVKSLLVRARISLAEAAEARLLTCAEVRLELGQVAEGLLKSSAPVRRHLKNCERCRTFRSELRRANRALAAVYPLGPLVLLKKFGIAKLGLGGGGGAAASGSTAAGGAGLAGGAAATGGAASGGILSAGATTIASKAAAGLAAAAIVTAGAVEVKEVTESSKPIESAKSAPVVATPAESREAVRSPEPTPEPVAAEPASQEVAAKAEAPVAETAAPTAAAAPAEPAAAAAPAPAEPAAQGQAPSEPATGGTQEGGSTVSLDDGGSGDQGGPPSGSAQPSTPPGESTGAPSESQPAPAAGESTGPTGAGGGPQVSSP